MNRKMMVANGLMLGLLFAAAPLMAQREGLDLAPLGTKGQTVSPFFEGWYGNPDGTYTLSFGYFNRNTQEDVEIPLGPDNYIEPAIYDGMQPTYFPPVNYGGYSGRRERGVFAVTVPADFADKEVVWTLRMDGEILRVPGRVNSTAYELSTHPMAMGSFPPVVWFETGKKGFGPQGIVAERTISAKVGQPVEISVFASDERSDREGEDVPLNVTWWKHQGPGDITFADETTSIPLGSTEPATTTATFSEAGQYIVRARVDNHRAPDSSPGDQCCWSNGYLRVSVGE